MAPAEADKVAVDDAVPGAPVKPPQPETETNPTTDAPKEDAANDSSKGDDSDDAQKEEDAPMEDVPNKGDDVPKEDEDVPKKDQDDPKEGSDDDAKETAAKNDETAADAGENPGAVGEDGNGADGGGNGDTDAVEPADEDDGDADEEEAGDEATAKGDDVDADAVTKSDDAADDDKRAAAIRDAFGDGVAALFKAGERAVAEADSAGSAAEAAAKTAPGETDAVKNDAKNDAKDGKDAASKAMLSKLERATALFVAALKRVPEKRQSSLEFAELALGYGKALVKFVVATGDGDGAAVVGKVVAAARRAIAGGAAADGEGGGEEEEEDIGGEDADEDFELAWTQLEVARLIFSRDPSTASREADTRAVLGDLLIACDEAQQAGAEFEAAATLFEKCGEERLQAECLYKQYVAQRKEERGKAVAALRRAVELMRESGAEGDVVEDLVEELSSAEKEAAETKEEVVKATEVPVVSVRPKRKRDVVKEGDTPEGDVKGEEGDEESAAKKVRVEAAEEKAKEEEAEDGEKMEEVEETGEEKGE